MSKKLNELREDVKNTNFCFNSDDSGENYELITDLLSKMKHLPQKTFLRGRQAPFINKKLSKAIYYAHSGQKDSL